MNDSRDDFNDTMDDSFQVYRKRSKNPSALDSSSNESEGESNSHEELQEIFDDSFEGSSHDEEESLVKELESSHLAEKDNLEVVTSTSESQDTHTSANSTGEGHWKSALVSEDEQENEPGLNIEDTLSDSGKGTNESPHIENPDESPENTNHSAQISEESDDESNDYTNSPQIMTETTPIPKEKLHQSFQQSREPRNSWLSSDEEIIDDSVSVIDLSSEEEELHPIYPTVAEPAAKIKAEPAAKIKSEPTVKPLVEIQPTKYNTPREPNPVAGGSKTDVLQQEVTQAQFAAQNEKLRRLQMELLRAQNATRAINLQLLPDKGQSLMNKQSALQEAVKREEGVLKTMKVVGGDLNAHARAELNWNEIEAGVDAVAPRTFGRIGVARYQAEKSMALETLDELHKSLATCPTENDFAEDPKGIKVPLMQHQKRALAWLLFRENQKPSGGILADDMGLGKTLTMISLIMKSLRLEQDLDTEKENRSDKYQGGTLIVCPASLINQWSGEVENKTKRGLLDVEVYHGAKRETSAKRLSYPNMVVTTYAIVLNESEKNGPLFRIKWRRIVLDEAHQIRNHKSKTSEAICSLSAKSRWALTGTPVHNKDLDMYALLKFLKCCPFDDLRIWKHWVSDKSSGGQQRLHAVISSLMLRRTKAELMDKGVLQSLPSRHWEQISVQLSKDEVGVYSKILIFSRTLFAQFLHQRAEKNQDAVAETFNGVPNDPNSEYFKIRNRLLRLHKVKTVSQHQILVLLLRLRQICCHPSLIIKMIEGAEDLGDSDDEESEELNLLDQLNKLNINEDGDHYQEEEAVGLKEATKGFLNPSNPVFNEDRPSSKIITVVKVVKEKVAGNDKAIIVSQWPSFLRLVGKQLKLERIIYDTLDGSIPVSKRMELVDTFNDPTSDVKVLLLSLTAGGVGLNLVGANHLFLLDLHWNPQLENQAQDRIYRMGQTKPIFVYKFMAVDTIEERIKALQDRKLDLANSIMTGSKQIINNKLTLQDLKMLFDFK